jgi:hypothetical protein
MGGATGLFFVLLNFIITDWLISNLSAEILHGLGVAVGTIIGADAGGGQVQGVDLVDLSRGEFGAEPTASAAETFLIANPDWYFQGLVACNHLGDEGKGFACESESSTGVFIEFSIGILGQGFQTVKSLEGDDDWDVDGDKC